MQVKLKPEAGPVVIVAEGDAYYQEFHREQEPFDASEEQWRILERTGLFEEIKSQKEKG